MPFTKLKVGLDIDGVISGFHFSFLLSSLLAPFSLIKKPDKEISNHLRKKNGKIKYFFISSRPPFSTGLTKLWLRKHEIPFEKVFCVGGRKEKIKKIIKEKIEVFIDDNPKIKKFFENSNYSCKVIIV